MSHKGPIPKDTLVELYSNQGLTMQQIGDQLGRCAPGILYWMRKHGIKSRPAVTPGSTAQYSRNDTFFQTWSPEMAWVLGLMFADGSISSSSIHGWRCSLSSVDKDLLKQVATLIETDAPIAQRSSSGLYTLCVGNTLVCKDLIAFGCTPNKSRTMQFPNVPQPFLSHFVRGLWDGDGCIFVRDRTRTKKTYREITTSYVSGSRQFVISLRDAIFEHVSINANVKERCEQYSPNWTISYYHRNSLRLLPWLYQGSALLTRLSRKFSLASRFIA